MKHAVVTGSTRGIGKAIADTLMQHGYRVFRNGTRELPDLADYIQADVATMAGVHRLVDTVIESAEHLDCLVLNAGLTCRKPFGETEYEDWQRVMDVNVNMPFQIVRLLRDRITDHGNIVFIGSDMGIYPHAASIPYGVSKAAAHMLAKSLVKEFAPRGIRVNAVAPGFVDTDWQREKPAWLREKIEGKVALRRFAAPEEIADAVWSLLQNTYINGTILQVDGGYLGE